MPDQGPETQRTTGQAYSGRDGVPLGEAGESPDEPFSFFDLRLGYPSFDCQPRRERAKRHLTTAEQFWHAAGDLVMRGGLGAACENMFAATELATMALMEVSSNAGWGHSRRSEWLRANGAAHGLTEEEAATLGLLHGARNVYRYGDTTSGITPASLVELVPYVAAVLAAARSAVESGDDDQGRPTTDAPARAP